MQLHFVSNQDLSHKMLFQPVNQLALHIHRNFRVCEPVHELVIEVPPLWAQDDVSEYVATSIVVWFVVRAYDAVLDQEELSAQDAVPYKEPVILPSPSKLPVNEPVNAPSPPWA